MLKRFFFIFLLSTLLACQKTQIETITQTNNVISISPWLENLNILQNAIAQGDKEKIKNFISFPFNNPDGGNDIWKVALKGKEQEHKRQDFQSKDFDDYFDNLFTASIRAEIHKINLLNLDKENISQSISTLENGETVKIVLSKDYINHEAHLTMMISNYGSKTNLSKDINNTIVYIFKIEQNINLKLHAVFLLS